MSKEIITGHDEAIGNWVMEKLGASWFPGHSVSIGLVEIDGEGKGEILAGVLYENFNKVSVVCDIAAVPGKRWLTRDYLWYIFYYPFVQLNCRRITTVVSSGNKESIRFTEALGFTLEATLKDAHPDGDLLIYKMMKESCRWLTLKEPLKCASQTSSKENSGSM